MNTRQHRIWCSRVQARRLVQGIAISAVVTPTAAHASTISPGRFGLGFSLIDPTGPSVKYTLSGGQALEASLGWSRRGVHIHGQYLLGEVLLTQKPEFHLDLFYGAGFRVLGDDDDARLGARLPLGLGVTLSKIPLEFSAQVAFVVNLVPETGLDADLTITARYFFD